MKRYPACCLCTCVVPWDERGNFLEDLFVVQVEEMLATTKHLYIFGTAGEGYAVTDAQFYRIVECFSAAMRAGGSEPMVGVVSLSLPIIQERIARCREMGVKQFQISLPSWGALTEGEVFEFFRQTCGRFPDCQFLHYNLMRTKRLVTPAEYGQLAKEHPNLVATKNSTDSMDRLRGLMTLAPDLQHFPCEGGYVYASQLGECGLLASVATNRDALREFFEAGQRKDVATLHTLNQELAGLTSELIAAGGPDAHIDGAFDKMLWKLTDRRFPLRLLPPYRGATDEGFARFERAVREKFPRWAPNPLASP